MAKLRFSVAVTTLLIGILGLLETTLQMFPESIPYPALRFFIAGVLPLLVAFLYQEENPAATVPPVINSPVKP